MTSTITTGTCDHCGHHGDVIPAVQPGAGTHQCASLTECAARLRSTSPPDV